MTTSSNDLQQTVTEMIADEIISEGLAEDTLMNMFTVESPIDSPGYILQGIEDFDIFNLKLGSRVILNRVSRSEIVDFIQSFIDGFKTEPLCKEVAKSFSNETGVTSNPKYHVSDWEGTPVKDSEGNVLEFSYQDALNTAMRLGMENLKPYLVNRA